MDRPQPGHRRDYRHFQAIGTRWMDNDVYGHVNNVVFYSWIDTAVNNLLIDGGVLDIHRGPVIGLVAETGCRYFGPVAFPDAVAVGVRVARIGTSSVRYEVGVFRGEESSAAAEGFLVHVYVDRVTRRPVALPEALRGFLQAMTEEADDD